MHCLQPPRRLPPGPRVRESVRETRTHSWSRTLPASSPFSPRSFSDDRSRRRRRCRLPSWRRRPPSCDGICDFIDEAGSNDCTGSARSARRPGRGLPRPCNIGDQAGSPDCLGACDIGDQPGSPDCLGACDIGDEPGSPTVSAPATSVTSPAPRLPRRLRHRRPARLTGLPRRLRHRRRARLADCLGACNIGDEPGSPDCLGPCNIGDQPGSPDCLGACNIGDQPARPTVSAPATSATSPVPRLSRSLQHR
jgi:hypothetical protein